MILLSLLTAALAWSAPVKVDQSFEIFLSPSIRQAATVYRDYPIFWWNSLVVDWPAANASGISKSQDLCHELARLDARSIRKIPCQLNFSSLGREIEDWLRDTPGRVPYSQTQVDSRLSESLTKASLPLGSDLFSLLRLDPLDQIHDLARRWSAGSGRVFESKGGIFWDAPTGRALVPVQMSFPPTEGGRTREFMAQVLTLCERFGCKGVQLFGPHAGSLENEMQIRQDAETVTWMGLSALAVLLIAILALGRQRLLLLLPLLAISIGVSAFLTHALFGSIHAITLSFGPGLVGLAMDYGIHAAFARSGGRSLWKTNGLGLATTLTILVLLSFSSVPLIRQMMVFSLIGLILSFGLFYLAFQFSPEWFQVKPFAKIQPAAKIWPVRLVEILMACSALLLLHPLGLDLRYMNYESAETRELTNWFRSKGEMGLPYSQIIKATELVADNGQDILKWADSNGIRYQGPARFLAPPTEASSHRTGWLTSFCEDHRKKLSPQMQKLFHPGFEFLCQPSRLFSFPRYLNDFRNEESLVHVLFAQDETQASLIRTKFPDAFSPREVLSRFPQAFSSELIWMVPTSIGLSLLMMFLYYRRIRFAIAALFPFLSALGFFALVVTIFNLPVTFVSILALLMVFGFSLDYGIFAVDSLIDTCAENQGVWSALSICALSTAIGFAPLLGAQHPVLHSLGLALFCGAIGTFIGTYWAIPGWVKVQS